MSVTFIFIFKAFSHKIWLNLIIKHSHVVNKNCDNPRFDFFLRQSVTKILRPITLSPNFNAVWRCDYIWVDSSCHLGSLYLIKVQLTDVVHMLYFLKLINFMLLFYFPSSDQSNMIDWLWSKSLVNIM